MLYKALSSQYIELGAHEVLEWNARDGVVFMPQSNSRIFLHWLSEKGNIRSTYTMTGPTRVEGNLRLTNALDIETTIQVVHLD